MKKLTFPLIILVSLLIGISGTYAALRTVYLNTHAPVHFHANFGIFINGEHLDFTNSRYMEDVIACSVTGEQSPKERVHMHNNIGDAIHVHASGVTWADFLTNIGFYADSSHLITDEQGPVYLNTSDKKMHFILNGKAVNNPINTLIRSEDRFLISYGSESESQLTEQFNTIASSAHELNASHDPRTCSSEAPTEFKFKFWQ